MSVRIWGNENSPNKLRRRLEQKAERGTLTREEINIIIKELQDLIAVILADTPYKTATFE